MNAPALVSLNIPSLSMAESELISVLESSLYPGAKLESIKLVIGYCRAQNLDPMQKPVHVVPMSVKQGNDYVWRDVVMPGIGLYRTQAARSGVYAGISEPEFGPDVTETLGGVEITYPQWCKMTAYRLMPNGQMASFSATERWKENYATKKKDTIAPNAMWQRRPYAQIAKCAEAQALRKAFPEIGAQPTAEEMEGKSFDDGSVIDGTATTVDTQPRQQLVQMPKAKSESTPKPKVDPTPPQSSNEPIRVSQLTLVRAKLARAEITEAELCKQFNVESADRLLASQINAVLDWINNPASEGDGE